MGSTINDRINSLINSLRMNKNSFGKFINVSPQNIHNIIGERQSKPSSEVLEKIITAVNGLESAKKLNSDWLLTGKGEMFIDSKSTDNGAFGLEVEKQLRERLEEKDQQLMEKDRFIMELLKHIDPKRLGKVKVAVQQAGALFTKPAPVTQASYVMQ